MDEGEKIRILIVDDVAETRETIRKLLQFESDMDVVGAARTGNEAIDLAKETKPDVILMDINMPDMDGITATENIRRDVQHVQIIILSIQSDPNYMRRAMLAGARDFLTKPPMVSEMTAAIRRAGKLAQEERTTRHSFIAQPGMNGGGMAGRVDADGKVIAVYSPKGGTGCTTVATNLAVTLNKLQGPVVLVDGNMQFGDVSVFLNQQSKNSVIDLAPRADELDPEIIDEVVINHQASGIKVLTAPARPEYAENVHGEAFGKVLEYLRHLYPYVVVDTASALTDVTLAVIDQADAIVLITTQDIPAIKNARLFFDLLGALDISRQRVIFVMNRYDKRIGITPEKVGESFKHEVAAVLPLEERIVVPSINRGVPFMLSDKSKPLERSFQGLAEVVRQRVSPETETVNGAESAKNGKR